jgi:hypothetical protein
MEKKEFSVRIKKEKERILSKNQERKSKMNKQLQWSICSDAILKVQA